MFRVPGALYRLFPIPARNWIFMFTSQVVARNLGVYGFLNTSTSDLSFNPSYSIIVIDGNLNSRALSAAKTEHFFQDIKVNK